LYKSLILVQNGHGNAAPFAHVDTAGPSARVHSNHSQSGFYLAGI
jgi:hypothetical protein